MEAVGWEECVWNGRMIRRKEREGDIDFTQGRTGREVKREMDLCKMKYDKEERDGLSIGLSR